MTNKKHRQAMQSGKHQSSVRTPSLGELHDEAMRFCSAADWIKLSRPKSDLVKAEVLDVWDANLSDAENIRRLYMLALENERRAAMCLADNHENEPSRAILFKGAAVIAWRIGEYDEAIRLAEFGLAGRPTAGLANELREIINLSQKAKP